MENGFKIILRIQRTGTIVPSTEQIAGRCQLLLLFLTGLAEEMSMPRRQSGNVQGNRRKAIHQSVLETKKDLMRSAQCC